MGVKAIIVNTPENTIQSDAQDWASIFNSIMGDLSGTFNYGRKLEVKKITDNIVRILDGVYSLQGHLIQVEKDTFEELIVESGTLGMNRIDAVVVEYEKSVDEKLNDKFSFKIIKGVAVAQGGGSPTLPNLIKQDLLAGGTRRQELLCSVLINDDKISSISMRSEILTTFEDVKYLMEMDVGGTIREI